LKAKPKPTKRDDVKENVLRFRASNAHLDILHQRAATVDMPVSSYVLWRSLKPLGRAKKEKERQDISRLDYEAYIQTRKELNRQGINLNQITKTLNSDKMHSQSRASALKDITAIREANEAILQSIVHLGGKNDWKNN
jgi:hypothetical protein